MLDTSGGLFNHQPTMKKEIVSVKNKTTQNEETSPAPKFEQVRRHTSIKQEREIERLITAVEDITDDAEANITGRLIDMAAQLISHRTPASGELASAIYKAIMRAWHRHRIEVYGYFNTADPQDREMVKYHGELLDACERAQGKPPRHNHKRTGPEHGDDKERRAVEDLRARLATLSDITDESERFRLEREIYDRERAGTSGNEWPEYITEGGAS
jgi:hypothetical protein